MKSNVRADRITLAVLLVALIALAICSRIPRVAAQGPPDAPSIVEESTPGDRLREGTQLVNVLGAFKLTGDRATFYPADRSGPYGGLENQTLERVATVIGEDPSPVEWLVSGTITEYRGNNYILVTRAILKSKPSALAQPTQ